MLIEHAAAAARAAAAFLAIRGGEDGDCDDGTPPASDALSPAGDRAVDKAGDAGGCADKRSEGEFVLRASHARVVRLIYGENGSEVNGDARMC